MGGAKWLPFSYEKPFDTVLCAQLMQQLEALGSPNRYAMGNLCTVQISLSEAVASIIR